MINQPLHHNLSKVDQFVHQVIVDGRYLEEFQQKPNEVAQKLGLTINAEIETTLRTSTANQLFESFYREQFKQINNDPHILTGDVPKVGIGFIIAIGVGIVIIVGIDWWARPGGSLDRLEPDITDESNERDSKL